MPVATEHLVVRCPFDDSIYGTLRPTRPDEVPALVESIGPALYLARGFWQRLAARGAHGRIAGIMRLTKRAVPEWIELSPAVGAGAAPAAVTAIEATCHLKLPHLHK